MDFQSGYKRFKTKKAATFIGAAFVCALVVQLLFTTNIIGSLAASVTQSMNPYPDIEIEAEDGWAYLTVQTPAKNVLAITFGLWNNPEGLAIKNVDSALGEVRAITDTPPYTYELAFYEAQDLSKEKIAVIEYDILDTAEPQSISLIDVKYTNMSGTHIPTMAGVEGL